MTSVSMINHQRPAARAALFVSLALALAGCASSSDNRMLDSIHQPVVAQNSYALDVISGPGGLSSAEQHRLSGWFEAMNLRYGDRIAVDDPLASEATRASVEAVVGRFGLLLSADAPVTPGYVNAGTVRVVLTRATAEVPHCPDWSKHTDANFANASNPNYGCAVNRNFAAMVADPNHLLKGAESSSMTTTMSSNKAIDTFRAQKPSGADGLKQTSSKGS